MDGSWLAGLYVRSRREEASSFEQKAQLAVAGERARIARELHDVIAHGVSLMGVQAAAAESALDSDPERRANRSGRSRAPRATRSRSCSGCSACCASSTMRRRGCRSRRSRSSTRSWTRCAPAVSPSS